ncbi:MAG: thioredoxin domain-containing protein [Actinomycetota bacterium]|nr:thioredoxin domain-containing protein [Actinomycetota bacterium]
MNRLAAETSPYLQQHKDNPVDWYPWGEEAFARARATDRPILLSVGYAACHWCHVMAHESFEDPAAAAVMNELFVNVKVDREERPDVDAVYMEAVQAMSGHGGWPMTMFLTPEGKPFFGGTYFPPDPRPGLPGFVQVCRAVADAWSDRRDAVTEQATELSAALGRMGDLAPGGGDRPGLDASRVARRALGGSFDSEWGGFGRSPKFPQPDTIEALLRLHAREGDAGALSMAITTLDAMAAGGIYDHLGGGFHRYSVDRQWLVPHFEKMLYDQALLVRAYLHAWQLTGETRHLQVLSETIDYVRRELRHPDGGFFSSEDADSEGVEGKFYVWSADELAAVAGPDAAEAAAWWGVTRSGNFHEPTGSGGGAAGQPVTGSNILHRPVRGDLTRSEAVERARTALFDARQKRVRPGLDDKVLTEWNALFVSALAEAGAATGRADWLADARMAGEFLLGSLRRGDGRWMRSWRQGKAGDPARAQHLAYAGDHAALVDAFTRLGEATGEASWVGEARSVADALIDLFADPTNGGFFTTGSDAERLIARSKDVLDNDLPSANAVAAVALHRLAALVGDDRYREQAETVVALMAETLASHPAALCHLLWAVELGSGPVVEVAVVGDRPDLAAAVQRRWLPGAVLAWGEPYPSPLFTDRREGMAYVCRNYACSTPTADVEELLAQLTSAEQTA